MLPDINIVVDCDFKTAFAVWQTLNMARNRNNNIDLIRTSYQIQHRITLYSLSVAKLINIDCPLQNFQKGKKL